jgi:GTP-binding protein
MNLYGIGPGDGVRLKPGRSGGFDRIVGIGGVLVVDLPGYGEGSLNEWGREIMKYLTQRKQLRRVFVLVDAEHGLKDKDRSLLASLRLAGVPHQVLLSKIDKVFIPKTKNLARVYRGEKESRSVAPKGSADDLRLKMVAIREEIQPRVGGGALGELLGVSSEVLVDGKRLGIDALRVAVLRAAGAKFEGPVKREGDKVRVRYMNLVPEDEPDVDVVEEPEPEAKQDQVAKKKYPKQNRGQGRGRR